MKAYTYERNGDGTTAYPVRLKHFETIALLSKAQVIDIYALGIPAKKRLKPDSYPPAISQN